MWQAFDVFVFVNGFNGLIPGAKAHGDAMHGGFAAGFVAGVGPGFAEKQCPGFDLVPIKTHLVLIK